MPEATSEVLADVEYQIGMTFDMLRAFLMMHPTDDLEAACDIAEQQVDEQLARLRVEAQSGGEPEAVQPSNT